MAKPTELAQKYMDAFFGQEPLESMEKIFAENLIFEGPFQRTTSAKAYLESLRKNPPTNVSFETEEVFENENSVYFIYQFSKPGVKTRMVQTFEVNDEKISKIKLVFDTKVFT
ncbi:MAG: nuclear transport factor 2 family protein [Betaproteobacteria bacterium]|jgi:hypothetical protein|nr:nuclear transport factor 2 family protein [Betaproteobacteria bacterium]